MCLLRCFFSEPFNSLKSLTTVQSVVEENAATHTCAWINSQKDQIEWRRWMYCLHCLVCKCEYEESKEMCFLSSMWRARRRPWVKVFALENLCYVSKEAATVKYVFTGQFIIAPIGLRLVNKLSWLTWLRQLSVSCAIYRVWRQLKHADPRGSRGTDTHSNWQTLSACDRWHFHCVKASELTAARQRAQFQSPSNGSRWKWNPLDGLCPAWA